MRNGRALSQGAVAPITYPATLEPLLVIRMGSVMELSYFLGPFWLAFDRSISVSPKTKRIRIRLLSIIGAVYRAIPHFHWLQRDTNGPIFLMVGKAAAARRSGRAAPGRFFQLSFVLQPSCCHATMRR